MTAGAILKSARQAERNGDKATAAALYGRLIKDFPESKEASSARLDITELGLPAVSESSNGKENDGGSAHLIPGSSSAATHSLNEQRKLVVKSEYKTTRIVLFFALVSGWLALLAGVAVLVGAGVIFLNSGEDLVARVAAGPTAGVGLGLLGWGLFFIMFSQNTRAALDSADYARETLILARRRAGR